MTGRLRDRRKLQAWTMLSFATAFLFSIFAPMEAYYANLDQYWFSLGQLLGVCLPVFLISFALMEGLGLLLSGKKAGDAVFALLLAAYVYFYIQGNFIPRDYGVLNGRAIDWDAYPGYAAASIAALLLCLGAGLALCLCFRDKLHAAGAGVCVFVLLVQLVTLGTLILQHGMKRQEEGTIVTQEHAFDLSRDRNLIVFVLDTYDAGFFAELLEQDREHLEDIFENFTWYPDTLSAYPTTRAAMPQILTGKWYENREPYEDFVAAAWEESPGFQALQERDYRVAVYTDPFYLSEDYTRYENTERGRVRIADRGEFARVLWRLVCFNYMPHQLKAAFAVDGTEFRDLKAAESGVPVFRQDTVKFARRFAEEGLSAEEGGNCFRLYHLDGVHDPATFGSALREDGGEYTATDEAAGNNELLAAWFQAMKEAGIYDSAAIIIMADHGRLAFDQNPLFLVKNAGERHAFTVSREEMSYEYLPRIWKTLAEGTAVNEGFVRACRPEQGQRRFLYYSWDDAWKRTYMPGMEEMLCDGSASEPGSLKPTGRSYIAEGEDRAYRPGSRLAFTEGRSAYPYVLYGISNGTLMQDAAMAFDLKGKNGDLTAEILLADSSIPGPLTVTANGVPVAEKAFSPGVGPIRVFIPEDCIDPDGRLELRFQRPESEADSAAMTPSGTVFREMRLRKAKRGESLEDCFTAFRYVPGTNAGFTRADPSGMEFILSGFSVPEEDGTWTDGKEAALRLRLPEETAGDLTLRIGYASFHGEQRVRVLANGTPVAELTAAGEEEREIRIPSECAASGTLELRLELPDAHSPASVGESTDERALALLIRSMQIVPAAGSAAQPGEESMGVVSSLLGGILNRCCALVGSRGWGIVLFTLVTKILLFPVALWTNRNSLKMVSVMPAVNRLKIRYYGDRDTIAEETRTLYQKVGYRPLAGTVPLFLQLFLLIGVIGAVRITLSTPESALSRLPAEAGGAALLAPAAAGLSALALGLAQNRLNSLQREQSRASQWATNGLSIAVSLFLGAFVPLGVVLYWICSNLMSILQQLVLNALQPPEKYVDYAALEQSRRELSELDALKGRVNREDRKREKADYRRFFSVVNKHLVFYSEGGGFYKYFRGYIEYLLKYTNLTIHYITGDAKDRIFEMERENPRIRAYYIGENRLITLMMKMDADMVVMTTPDLENFHIKRSYVRRDIEYVYVQHDMNNHAMLMRRGCTDHFDTIFCAGPHQKAEEEAFEAVYGLAPRKLVEVGYPLIDELRAAYRAQTHPEGEGKKILIAPSWQKDNIIDSCLEVILDGLKDRGYEITVRPHPQEVRQKQGTMQALKQKYEPAGIRIQTDFTSDSPVTEADLLITDWSGISWEYAFTTLRPVLFINTPMKIMNPDYREIPTESVNLSLRDQLGKSLELGELDKTAETAAFLLENREQYRERIAALAERWIYHLDGAAEVGGNYLARSIQDKIRQKKEKQTE